MEFRDMSSRAFLLASVLLQVLLCPAWAQDAPMATAPIPPAVKAAPEPAPRVAPKPVAPPAAQEKTAPAPPPAAAVRPLQPSPPGAAMQPPKPPEKSAAKPAAKVKEAEHKKNKPPADRWAKTEKAEKKAEKRIERNIAASARAAERRRWVVREQPRWPPPPPYSQSWYQRYDYGPMAYGPYGGGMRVPPPPWDD
jgi:hypothetical protein